MSYSEAYSIGPVFVTRDHGTDRWRNPFGGRRLGRVGGGEGGGEVTGGQLYRNDRGGWSVQLFGPKGSIYVAHRPASSDPVGEYRQAARSGFNTADGPDVIHVRPATASTAGAKSWNPSPEDLAQRSRARIAACRTCEHFEGRAGDQAVLCGKKGRGGCLDCRVNPTTSGTCPLGLWVERDQLTPSTPAAAVRGAIELPSGDPTPFPLGWHLWPNVQQAYRSGVRLAAANPPPRPTCDDPRGIVIAGGGKYFASTYVTLRAIREVGCRLPVEVWYFGARGEMTARQSEILTAIGDVRLVDADEVRKRHPHRRLNGWELKTFAVAHCGFEQVLFLDADSYPCKDPTPLFDHPEFARTGAIFFPDKVEEDLSASVWEMMGLPDRREMAQESGQFIVDKARCWRELCAAVWMNEHSDYYYKFIYGDKDTTHLAWRLCGTDYAMPEKRWTWHTHTMLQYDFDGRPAFCHRCRDKFALDKAAERFTTTHQVDRTANVRVPDLPMEDFCFARLEDLRRINAPGMEQRFTEIYGSDMWGNASGPGSSPAATEPYRAFLQQFLRDNGVRRVVDVGCGDWQFSRLIDWTGIDYVGVDVVRSVVSANAKSFGRVTAGESIRFIHGDAVHGDPSNPSFVLPHADLIILKDVLQHWSNDDVARFLPTLGRYRYALVTNTTNGIAANADIGAPGEYRFLDLRLPPFNAPAQEVLRWHARLGDEKTTLLLKGSS